MQECHCALKGPPHAVCGQRCAASGCELPLSGPQFPFLSNGKGPRFCAKLETGHFSWLRQRLQGIGGEGIQVGTNAGERGGWEAGGSR